MKIPHLLIAISATMIACTSGYSQIPYHFYSGTETYMPLTGATSLNSAHIWDSYYDNYAADMGFRARIDTANFSTAFIGNENTLTTDTSATSYVNGFLLEDAELIDRGTISGVTTSPIRYKVDGSPGSRIFKLEISNAGFHAEYDNYGTLSDFVNMQIWVYENSNIIELRYGPSSINHPSDYFFFGSGPLIAMANNVAPNGDGVLYMLSGNPAIPTIDSMVMTGGTPTYTGSPLSGFPHSGTVYRFIPKNLSVKSLAFEKTIVYPTYAADEIMVSYNSRETAWYKVVAITGGSTSISGALQNGITHVDISALPKGNYFVQLGNNEGKTVRKFVKL